MSEQENQNSMQCSEGLVRKEWNKPVIVELSEVNGVGAEGKFGYLFTEAGGRYAPS